MDLNIHAIPYLNVPTQLCLYLGRCDYKVCLDKLWSSLSFQNSDANTQPQKDHHVERISHICKHDKDKKELSNNLGLA